MANYKLGSPETMDLQEKLTEKGISELTARFETFDINKQSPAELNIKFEYGLTLFVEIDGNNKLSLVLENSGNEQIFIF